MPWLTSSATSAGRRPGPMRSERAQWRRWGLAARPINGGRDRREDGGPPAQNHVPARRSRDTTRSVRRHRAPHRPARNEAKPNMTAESSYTRPRQAIAIPEARPERCHRTLGRPNSASRPRIGGTHVRGAPACCLPGGTGARSTLSQGFIPGIPVGESRLKPWERCVRMAGKWPIGRPNTAKSPESSRPSAAEG